MAMKIETYMLHSVHVHLTVVLLLTVCVYEVILVKCFRFFAVLKKLPAFWSAGVEVPEHRPPGEQKARWVIVQDRQRFIVVDFPATRERIV